MRLFPMAAAATVTCALAVPLIGYTQGGAQEAGQNLPIEFFDRMMTVVSADGGPGSAAERDGFAAESYCDLLAVSTEPCADMNSREDL